MTLSDRRSVIVLFPLVAHRQDNHIGRAGDFVQRDVSGSAERDDEFSPRRAVADLAKAVGRFSQMMPRGRAAGLDGSLSQIQVFYRLRSVEHKFKEAFQVVVGRSAEANVERSTFNVIRRAVCAWHPASPAT